MHRLSILIALAALSTILNCSSLAADVGAGKSFKGPTGLVLYSLRDLQKAQGPVAMLDKTKSFGFRYVELSSDFGGLKPAEFKAELDKRGLVPVGQHFDYKRIRDDIDAVAAEAKAMGLPYVACPWIPHEGVFGEKQCRETAAVFNRAGEVLARQGIKFCYHNHGYEFHSFGSGTIFDLLVSQTNPKTVFFEMDVLWVVLPGQDPAALLKKYPDRWLLMHIKDLKKGVALNDHSAKTALTNDVSIGSGQVDWPKLLRTAQEVGVKYYLIEDESPSVIEQIPQSLRFLESVEW
jgi:sugar phosphate isomerase/epimerase